MFFFIALRHVQQTAGGHELIEILLGVAVVEIEKVGTVGGVALEEVEKEMFANLRVARAFVLAVGIGGSQVGCQENLVAMAGESGAHLIAEARLGEEQVEVVDAPVDG